MPAAGRATRLGRLTCSKEVLPVLGRPVMSYVVERMWAAGARTVRVVTRPEKLDVIETARKLRAEVVVARPPTVSDSVLAAMEALHPGDVVLLGFPDTIWEPPDGYCRLIDGIETGAETALGLFTSPEPSRGDVVTLDPSGRVLSVEVKPRHPSSDLIWGCAATLVGVLLDLQDPEPGVHFDDRSKRGRTLGLYLSDTFIDIGVPNTYRTYVDSPETFLA